MCEGNVRHDIIKNEAGSFAGYDSGRRRTSRLMKLLKYIFGYEINLIGPFDEPNFEYQGGPKGRLR
jgi:hypothetical protein